MTEEEIKKLVEARIAQAVTQIGKNLENRYVRKEEVHEAVSHVLAREMEKWAEQVQTHADQEDSPVFRFFDEMSDLQLQVLELQCLALLDRKKGLVGKDMDKTMQLIQFTNLLAARTRQTVEAGLARFDHEGTRLLRETLTEFLGELPETKEG